MAGRRNSLRPLVAGLLLVGLVLAGCSGGRGDEATEAGVKHEGEPLTTTSSTSANELPQPADSSKAPPSTTPTTAAMSATPRIPASKYDPRLTEQQGARREVSFALRRDDPVFQGSGPAFYDGVQEVTGSGVAMTWTLRRNEPEPVRRLARHGSSWSGSHVPELALDWKNCAWSPMPVYVPELRVGARSEIASECVSREHGGNSHIRITGHVAVTGTKDVRIDSKPFKTWVIERRWHTVVTGDGNGEADFETIALWSPDFQMIVKQDAHSWTPPDPNTPDTNLRTHLDLVGLEV